MKKVIAFFLLFLLLLVGARNSISDPNFWYDETGQLLISKGQYHYAPSQTEDGTLIDLFHYNQLHNSDPGGFSLILRYWQMLSNKPEWLRLLPYSFFALSIVVIYLFNRNRTGRIFLSLVPVTFYYYFPLIRDYAFELRAYSMESLGVIISTILFIKLAQNPMSKKYFAYFFATNSFFVFSRYSYVFIPISLIFSLLILRLIRLKPNINLNMIFSTFVSVVVIYFLIYLLTVSGQNPSAVIPNYVQSITLKFSSLAQSLEIISRNLFSFTGIWWVVQVVCVFFYIIRNKIYKTKLFDFTKNELVSIHLALLVFLYQFLLFFVSLIGKHPWSIESRWNIGMQSLSFFCFNFLFTDVLNQYFSQKLVQKHVVSAIMVSGLIVVSLQNIHTYFRKTVENSYFALNQIIKNNKRSKLWVSYKFSPNARYFFEMSPMNANSSEISTTYESQYEYEQGKIIDVKQYDYLIIYESLENIQNNYQNRLIGFEEFTRISNNESYVYKHK